MDLESKSYGDSDGAKKSIGYLEFLKQPKVLSYLGFLIDLVNSLSKLSELFQANMLLICEIRRCTEEKAAAIKGAVSFSMSDVNENARGNAGCGWRNNPGRRYKISRCGFR